MSNHTIPTSLPFQTPITVYINDLVGGLHVGNHVLISYLNEAQMRLLTIMGFPSLTVGRAVTFNTEIWAQYRAEVRYGMSIAIHAGITRLDDSDYDIAYRIINTSTGKAALLACFTMAFVDLDTGKKVPVPEVFRVAAAPYIAQIPPA